MKSKFSLLAIMAMASGLILTSCGGGNNTPGSSGSNPGSGSNPSTSATSGTEEKIELSAPKTTITVDETVQITSSVDGVTYSSRDESVASVSASGLVTGLKAGSTTITARKTGYKLGSLTFTVTKAAMKEAQGILEFEFADHYDPDGVWGYPQWGIGPGDSPIEEVESASGGQSVGWFNQGCKETIKFTSSKAGNIDMGFMMAYNAEVVLDGNITIAVNGTALNLAGQSVAGPSDDDTNNYYDWNEVMFKDVAIKSGENEIVVECIGSGVNMDCVRLYGEGYTFEQIKILPMPSLTVTSGAISIYPEQTSQITVAETGVSYASENQAVATVNASGLVTGVAPGKTNIVISKEGYKDTNVAVTVNEPLPEGEYRYLFEMEDATHYAPDGVWGWPAYGMSYDTPVEEHPDAASGDKSIGWFNTGCTETIAFSATKAGKVSLVFMMAYASEMVLANVITIKVNNVALNLDGKVVEAGGNNNYTNWKPITFSNVDIKAGDNVIVIEAIGNGPNMDCMTVIASEDLGIVGKVAPAPATPEVVGKVDYFVGGYEFGPMINGVLLKLDAEVAASQLSDDLFTVKTNGTKRTVTSLYLTDVDGNPINATSGKYVRLDLQVRYESNQWGGGNDYGGSPFTYSGMNQWKQNITVEVRQNSGTSLTIGEKTYGEETVAMANQVEKRIIPDVKDWGAERTYTDGTYTLRYKAYETDTLRNDGVKNPLIIWLHGQGEGGTDVDIALLGNDVTNLGQEKVQSHFVKGNQKGAYVLAVQSPTMWMDNGSGQNHGGNAHSIYTSCLKGTIDKFIADNNDIDTSKIIVGGCSNGGYMTMELAMTYPNFFAAYYPTCEAFQDAVITDQDIQTLKGLSIWFTHAANDSTVNPNNFTVATYKRLMAAGAEDVHFSYFTDVRGSEGRIDDGYNNYMGHYSWIYVLKDECDKDVASATNPTAPSTENVMVGGQAVSLWGWAASK